MAEPRRVHYVLSSHWDREWHQPFQVFRYRLVQLLDRVIGSLEDGSLAGPFFCDGQAIVIEDYLAIRPENRDRLTELMRRGKLIAGPWYDAPDMFAVSGEALVSNLRLGRSYVRQFGAEPSQAGFSCDTFGHISQLPQIFSGFDIPAAFIWRGTNYHERRHVIWRGADGTDIPTFRFGTNGYWGYFVRVRGLVDHPVEAETFRHDLLQFISSEAAHTEVDPVFLFDGADHQAWNDEDYAALGTHLGREEEGFEIIHSSPDAYMAEMLPQAARISTRLEGELLEPAKYDFDVDQQGFPQGVWSSRVWLKQDNALNQALLCNWAEPFTAFARGALGTAVPTSFLHLAWKTLLENHAHDSIGGCSIDEVHADMAFRNRQVRQIADRLTEESLRGIAASIAEPVAEEVRVTIFNPLPVPVEEVVDVVLPLPAGWATDDPANENPPRPYLNLQQDGQPIPHQLHGWRLRQQKLRLYPARAPQQYQTNDAIVALPLALPPMGYTTLEAVTAQPPRQREAPGAVLAPDDRTLENAFLRVAVETNGRLTLTDKRTQQVYAGLLAFEDMADIGSGYNFGPAPFDQAFSNAAAPAGVAVVENGPYKAGLRIRQTLHIPAQYDFQNGRRAHELLPLAIDSTITLRQGAARLEVETRVHNVVRDHRLRVLFPSGAVADTYLADTPFDVVERAISLPVDAAQWREVPQETKPQQSWTAVHDSQRGLAVVTAGLLETAVRDLPQRPIALTLFRATRHIGNLIPTPEENNGQALREMTFKYWIVPLDGAPDRAQLSRWGQQILTGFRAVALHKADGKLYRRPEQLPASAGLLQVTGQAVVTSLRDMDGILELRLFNPYTVPQEIGIGWSERPAAMPAVVRVQRVNLESKPLSEPQPVHEDSFYLTLGAKEIATLRLMAAE